MKKLRVGSELDSYCGKCKMELRHAIVAMVDEMPKRVRCLTCSSEHNHRLIKAKSSAVKPKTRRKGTKSPSRKALENAAHWTALMADWDDGRALKYSVFGSFQLNDHVVHSSFGKGFVVQVPGPDRILTLFEKGEKLLLQGKVKANQA